MSRASAETVPAGDVGSSTHLRGTRDLGTVGALQATIVDSMAEGVALISSVDGTILYTNAGFDAMLGYERDELLNVAASVVSPPGDDSGREGIVLEIAEALEHERVWQGEVENRRKDGTTIWCLVSVTPLPLENDEPVWVAVHTDISKRRRADREQARVHEATVEASKTMSGFVANLSHEIRTPLNGVIGMTRLLGDSTLDSVQREYVDALAISGEALLSVIGDVLDFSKIEAGRMALDPTDFDLRDAVEESCLMLAEQAHRKGLQINHWVDVDVPTVVRADRARLRQILLNLLNNAVKFTASGEVLLRVSGHESALLEFAVEDTGVGIENIQASSLFDPFVQADPTTTREYGGTGLGLAIARQLVRCMGGEIGARPREGGG